MLEITAQGMVNSYEIGDDAVMAEWYGPLDSGITYRFWSEPAQPITAIDSTRMTLSETRGTAYIINEDTSDMIVSWDIDSASMTVMYELLDANSRLRLTTELNGQSLPPPIPGCICLGQDGHELCALSQASAPSVCCHTSRMASRYSQA